MHKEKNKKNSECVGTMYTILIHWEILFMKNVSFDHHKTEKQKRKYETSKWQLYFLFILFLPFYTGSLLFDRRRHKYVAWGSSTRWVVWYPDPIVGNPELGTNFPTTMLTSAE